MEAVKAQQEVKVLLAETEVLAEAGLHMALLQIKVQETLLLLIHLKEIMVATGVVEVLEVRLQTMVQEVVVERTQ
jgi:hypothetical protein